MWQVLYQLSHDPRPEKEFCVLFLIHSGRGIYPSQQEKQGSSSIVARACGSHLPLNRTGSRLNRKQHLRILRLTHPQWPSPSSSAWPTEVPKNSTLSWGTHLVSGSILHPNRESCILPTRQSPMGLTLATLSGLGWFVRLFLLQSVSSLYMRSFLLR